MVSELNDNHVSTYEDASELLHNSLLNHYGVDVEIANPGEYYLCATSLLAKVIERKVQSATFHGNVDKVLQFAEWKADTFYYEDSLCQCFEIGFGSKTRLRCFMPKGGITFSQCDLSLLAFDVDGVSARVDAHYPEFAIETKLGLDKDDARFLKQEARISVDRHGIRTSSFTVSGPTSDSPAYEIECWLDRPFLFSIIIDRWCPCYIGAFSSE